MVHPFILHFFLGAPCLEQTPPFTAKLLHPTVEQSVRVRPFLRTTRLVAIVTAPISSDDGATVVFLFGLVVRFLAFVNMLALSHPQKCPLYLHHHTEQSKSCHLSFIQLCSHNIVQ